MSGITIPFLRRPYRDDRLVLTTAGETRIADIPDVEFMLSTDGYCPLYRNDQMSGFLRLSKSGNTIYAELPDTKIRFPYGVFIGMLKSNNGEVVGSYCDGVTA